MKIKCAIFHPYDPRKCQSDGIATVINNLIQFAPSNIEFCIFGISYDNDTLYKSQKLILNQKEVEFLPVLNVEDKKSYIPKMVRYLIKNIFNKKKLKIDDFDVIIFHRIEQALPFFRFNKKKICIVHTSVLESLNANRSEVKWAYLPWLYRIIEKLTIQNIDRLLTVNMKTLQYFNITYPSLKHKFYFMPQVVDMNIFSCCSNQEILSIRQELSSVYDIPLEKRIVIYVGRFDKVKRPLLLLEVFNYIKVKVPGIYFILIGNGNLLVNIHKKIDDLNLQADIKIIENLSNNEVAKFMQVAELLVLLSYFEGMPMVILEALSTGIPVVSSDVGQVSSVVTTGVNGEIVGVDDSVLDISETIINVLDNIERYKPEQCVKSVLQFQSKFDYMKLLT